MLEAYLTKHTEAFFNWWYRLTVRQIRAEIRQGQAELASKEIRRVGGRYYVYTTTGRRLGAYPTLAGARRRLRQVEFFGSKDVPTLATDPIYWEAVRQQFNATMTGPVSLVIRQGMVAPESLGVGVDFSLLNNAVQQLAANYTHDSWQVLSDAQRLTLQTSLNDWVASGRPQGDLIKRLQSSFSSVKAELWGSTEATRLFNEGQAASYMAAGIREVEWTTAADKRVCNICGPLDGRQFAAAAVSQAGPPIHPRCRCDVSPVINGKVPNVRVQHKINDGAARSLIRKAQGNDAHVSGQMWRQSNLATRQATSQRGILGSRNKLPNGNLVGIDYRLKGRASLTRKMNTMFSEEGFLLDDIPANISDALRYTQVFDPEDYARGMARTMASLQDEGYDVLKFKNYWGGDMYQGVNTVIRGPNGQVFELQFHTPQSFHTKEFITHKWYEAARKLPISHPDRKALERKMASVWRHVGSPVDPRLRLADLAY